MATCRVCSATLTDDPAEVSGKYEEYCPDSTLLQSQVSKAMGESLCTNHWEQMMRGNDTTPITTITQSSGVGTMTVSSTAPANPNVGDIWCDYLIITD